MAKSNNPPDEVHSFKFADLERRGGQLRLYYPGGQTETWTLPDNSWGVGQAKENFKDMVKRWAGE